MTTIKLNKEQSKKADLLLKSLCDSDETFDREEADKIFKSKSESDFVCLLLEKKGLIDIVAQTENDLLYRFTKTEFTYGFLKNGGLRKEYSKAKELDWYKIVPIILTIVFGALTIYYANLNYESKIVQEKSIERTSELKRQNASLNTTIDSLKSELSKVENNSVEQ